jgi:hypothetical protein
MKNWSLSPAKLRTHPAGEKDLSSNRKEGLRYKIWNTIHNNGDVEATRHIFM